MAFYYTENYGFYHTCGKKIEKRQSKTNDNSWHIYLSAYMEKSDMQVFADHYRLFLTSRTIKTWTF